MNSKQRNIILLLGFVALIWIAYFFAFSKTIKAIQQYRKLKHQDEFFTSASQNLNNLKQQVIYYNSLLSKYQISSESSYQNNLLNTLNEYSKAHKLKIINFKDPIRFQLNHSAIQETYIFTVESDYNSIVNLIYNLEQRHKFGKIISARFEKEKNYKTQKRYLLCTVFLQKVSQE
jgi:hypothetical protein